MVAPYLAHFALKDPPFSKEVADSELWLAHVQASRRPICSSRRSDDHASAVLGGEPASARPASSRASPPHPRRRLRLTYCHNATLGRRDFYRQLCHALGLTPATTAGSLFYRTQPPRRGQRCRARPPVFLLDESHLLHRTPRPSAYPPEYAWDSRALLSLVLVGLPELRERLALPESLAVLPIITGSKSVRSPRRHFRVPPHAPQRVGCTRESSPPMPPCCSRGHPSAPCATSDRLAARHSANRHAEAQAVERDVVTQVIEADTRERDR